jgi:hypothetical protein
MKYRVTLHYPPLVLCLRILGALLSHTHTPTLRCAWALEQVCILLWYRKETFWYWGNKRKYRFMSPAPGHEVNTQWLSPTSEFVWLHYKFQKKSRLVMYVGMRPYSNHARALAIYITRLMRGKWNRKRVWGSNNIFRWWFCLSCLSVASGHLIPDLMSTAC